MYLLKIGVRGRHLIQKIEDKVHKFFSKILLLLFNLQLLHFICFLARVEPYIHLAAKHNLRVMKTQEISNLA